MSDARAAAVPERAGAVLVAGVGARRGVAAEEVVELVGAALAVVGRSPAALVGLATVEAKAAEPGVLGAARRLGVPLWSFPAADLAAVRVPAPSAAARAAVGTPSVAEAAALLAAGPGAHLVLGKRVSAPEGRPAAATCALAAPAAPDTWDTPAITSGTTGAADTPPAAAAIVIPSPNPRVHAPAPPERLTPRSTTGADRRAAEVGGCHPEQELPGTKETF
ncbi:cobalamin biosynthesis protein [Streptomyces sp. NPDC058000]|uniref:cobalamin biosynthesis protein n=1 Tax=Streptomyces sp. NPDC058000 TaxID=3346299 RepID=UPI0036E7CB4B